ncbi:MAG TPA: hypothetical protein DC006_01315 [Prevotellaceae bacterium]|nr:hypothetical protein [Prevotellaceae bacterium]
MNEEDEEYFRSPEFRELLGRYEHAVARREPVYMEADELTDIAEYYMAMERGQDADRVIALAQALHPGSVDPQVFLARRQLFAGNTGEAWRISRAIPDQEDREVKFLNAEILIKEGRCREATVYLLHEWRGLDDERDLFLYDSAGVFMDYNMWEYALMWVGRLERLYPQFPKTRRMKAELLVCLGRYEEAMPMLESILDDDPYSKDVWNMLAESQGATEQYAEALNSAEFVLAIEKDNLRAMVTKATCLFHMNQQQEAHSIYQACLRRDPDDNNVLYLDAVCLAALERYGEALALVVRALSAFGTDLSQAVYLLVEKAYLQSKMHHADEALETVSLAEKARGEGVDGSEYCMLRGQIQLENGREDGALRSFGDALRASSAKRDTLMAIGMAYGDAEYYADAIQVMLTVMRHFPDSGEGMSPIPYLAYYYYRAHDLESSLQYLRQAAETDRQSTERLFGSIYPGVTPDEYYDYAFRDVYGHFPGDGK